MRPFEPGQGRAQAEVDAVAEGQVMVDLAVDVEPVGVGEPPLVPVARGGQQEDGAPGGHHLAVVLDVLGHVPGLHRRRGLEAEQLLDGVRHQAAVLDQLGALVGMVGQHLARSSRSGGWWSRCPPRPGG